MANVLVLTSLIMIFKLSNGRQPELFDNLVKQPSWKFIKAELVYNCETNKYITLEEMFDMAYEKRVSLERAYVEGYQIALKNRTVKYIILIASYAHEIIDFDVQSACLYPSSPNGIIQKIINLFKIMRYSVEKNSTVMFVRLGRYIDELKDSSNRGYYLNKLDEISNGFTDTVDKMSMALLDKNTNFDANAELISLTEDLIKPHKEQFDVAYVFKTNSKEKQKLMDIFDKIEKLVKIEYEDLSHNNKNQTLLRVFEKMYYSYVGN